jgi:hypothetical protein
VQPESGYLKSGSGDPLHRAQVSADCRTWLQFMLYCRHGIARRGTEAIKREMSRRP